jgi:hypothetical protein
MGTVESFRKWLRDHGFWGNIGMLAIGAQISLLARTGCPTCGDLNSVTVLVMGYGNARRGLAVCNDQVGL